MTLEIGITETVNVTDVLEPIIKWFRRILSWLKPADDTVDTPETDEILSE